jgi:hypothetical protein
MTTISQPVNPREAAREWIAETLRTHLRADLHPVGGPERIKEVAASVEAEAYAEGWPIETAIELAIEWCEARNDEAGHGI